MKNIALGLAVAAVAAGCALYEGGAGGTYSITCPAQELQICFAKARELCPRGYDVVSMRRSEPPIILPDQVNIRCAG